MTYNEGVQKLRDLHINTPEVICAFPKQESEEKAAQIDAILKATADRLTCKVCIRTSTFQSYACSPDNLVSMLNWFSTLTSFITIFKAPKSKYEIRGVCIPSPHYNRFTNVEDYIHQSYQAVTIWGQPMDQYPFPVGIRTPARLVNEALVNNRMELDGQEIEFTYHLEPEGSMQQNIVFWGMRSPSYEG